MCGIGEGKATSSLVFRFLDLPPGSKLCTELHFMRVADMVAELRNRIYDITLHSEESYADPSEPNNYNWIKLNHKKEERQIVAGPECGRWTYHSLTQVNQLIREESSPSRYHSRYKPMICFAHLHEYMQALVRSTIKAKELASDLGNVPNGPERLTAEPAASSGEILHLKELNYPGRPS